MQTAFVLAVVFKTVQEALIVRRKRLEIKREEIKREQQELDEK